MKKIRVNLFFSTMTSSGYSVLGIIYIVFGAVTKDTSQVVQGCALLALGFAFLFSVFQRILALKLDTIHGWFGPYQQRKIDKRGYIFNMVGVFANVGASNFLILSIVGQSDYNNLAIGLIGLSLGLSSLGQAYFDNQKYDDVAEAFQELQEHLSQIEERIDKANSTDTAGIADPDVQNSLNN